MSKGFFDNDLLIKLAGCGLVHVASEHLGIEESWILPSVKPRLINKKRRDKLAQYFDMWPEHAQSQILSFVDQSQKFPPSGNQAFIQRYHVEQGLDIGEIQLLDAALSSDNSFVITGDKRFLKELATIPDLLSLTLSELPGQFACFESILLLLIDQIGFEAVRDRVLPFKEIEGQIKIAFGGGASKTEAQTREALLYELRKFGTAAAPLLHYPI